MATSLIAVRLDKCRHKATGVNVILPIPHHSTVVDVFNNIHGEIEGFQVEAKVSTSLKDGDLYTVHSALAIGDLKEFYSEIKTLHLKCCQTSDAEEEEQAQKPAAAKTVNAFNILMSGQKVHPKKKTCNNRKDELYNDVVADMINRDLKFHKCAVDDEGTYIVQVITHSIWYLTNHHTTINEIAQRHKDVYPVPSSFDKFEGYDDYKRKKVKCQPLSSLQCQSHADALFSITCRPIFQSSDHWISFKTVVEDLAKCLAQYHTYLEKQLQKQNTNQSKNKPARTVMEDIAVDYREKLPFINDRYKLFDIVMSRANYHEPIVFDESIHLDKPFENPTQKHRYFQSLRLSVPVDLYSYCPGGGICMIYFAARVHENRTENDFQVQPLRVVSKIHDQLPEYHTRYQRRYFKQKLSLISSVKPAVMDFIYKELALDASAASNPVTQQRLELITLGETGLVADLRELNPGRPNNKFDSFFQTLQEKVENITAADDRRHGEAHISRWISLDELISDTANDCPDGTLIPSKSLVRLQFTPRNRYTHAALNFTERIKVQYKIQRRQLRISHQDAHYCAAQLKYMKSKLVELGPKALLLCCDDKAKVPVGDPGVPVSTGVRGKKTIAPVAETLVACDHDMTKSSLCPSVYLECDTPTEIAGSLVRGQVNVIVNDSVMQVSSPFRHAVAICNILKQKPSFPSILLKFSDGGTDQRNTLESVKCGTICIFQELNLDMCILGRCAPGHSLVNPAERVMSILNLGLQNCALERNAETEGEDKFKSCGSMTQIRDAIRKTPELKGTWESSIKPVQQTVAERFQRLKLKDIPFRTPEPVQDAEIDLIQRHLRELFPDLDLTKLQKVHTKKSASYQSWIEKHCRERHYNFQIRKCEDPACCAPSTVPREFLDWLPDPVLDGDSNHYKQYDQLKGIDTTEDDRPSYHKPVLDDTQAGEKKKARKRKPTGNLRCTNPPLVPTETEDATASEQPGASTPAMTAQNARYLIECCECRKPRVIYSKNKLTSRQIMRLTMAISESDYTCGSFISAPDDIVHVRPHLKCSDNVELSFYSSSLGRKDLCCHCGTSPGEVSQELLQRFKTVLPICTDCLNAGFEPVCQRPYGKKN